MIKRVSTGTAAGCIETLDGCIETLDGCIETKRVCIGLGRYSIVAERGLIHTRWDIK